MFTTRFLGTGLLVLAACLLVVPHAGARPPWAHQSYAERLRDLGRAEAEARRQLIDQANCDRKQALNWFVNAKRCSPRHTPELAREYSRRIQAINCWFADANRQLTDHFRVLRDEARDCLLHGHHDRHVVHYAPAPVHPVPVCQGCKYAACRCGENGGPLVGPYRHGLPQQQVLPAEPPDEQRSPGQSPHGQPPHGQPPYGPLPPGQPSFELIPPPEGAPDVIPSHGSPLEGFLLTVLSRALDNGPRW